MFSINRRVVLGAVGALAATAALTLGANAAGADRQPINAAGNTVIQFNNQALRALQTNGCGTLSASGIGGGVVTTTGVGKVNVKLPISGLAVNPDTGRLRIAHAGSGIDLANSCYDLRLTNFYVQNFGDGDQYESFDVLAKVTNPDGTDREQLFTLDLSSASATVNNGGNLKIRFAKLLLDTDGANQFNELATGNQPDEAGNVAGPFYAGQQAGMGRTSIRLQYAEV